MFISGVTCPTQGLFIDITVLPSIYNLVPFKFKLAENFCCFFNISEAYMLTIYILFK
jgi:hypothetical protein